MYNFRTDLAMERTSMYKRANKLENIDGIETKDEEIDKNIKVNIVNITNNIPKDSYINPSQQKLLVTISSSKKKEILHLCLQVP